MNYKTKYGRIKVELTIDFVEYISEAERNRIIQAIPEMIKQIYNPTLKSNIENINIVDINGSRVRTIPHMSYTSVQVEGFSGWREVAKI